MRNISLMYIWMIRFATGTVVYRGTNQNLKHVWKIVRINFNKY